MKDLSPYNRPAPAIEPTRRLSIWRVLIALAILGGAFYATRISYDRIQNEVKPETLSEPWFASYVDVTSTPHYPFEQLGSTATPQVILAFIVASPKDPCLPTWGTHYTLEEAAVALDLDRRIARLEQQGGRIAVSFGGALNNELSSSCSDEEALFRAYQAVIERYRIDTIDIDLERENLTNKEAGERRAKVIARLQEHYRNNGKHLAVWLTLPVAPQGLTEDGTNAVSLVLTNGVDLAGVNVMTMDYGASRAEGQSVLDTSKAALMETKRQLGILYQQKSLSLSEGSLWRKVGATPMIGQNDVVEEVFTLEDAKAFNTFAQEKGISRMSMWSANRDIPCGENYVDTKVVSDACSGVKSPKGSFGEALSQGFPGDLAKSAELVTVQDGEKKELIVDDPKTSPYQIWQENGAYPKGTKVVWHGNVYEAKWWTKKDLPDNPVLQAWETPWQLVGPVLPGEKLIEQPTLPVGTYPKWSGQVVYEAGDRVLFDGIPFQSKWWNEGESPAASAANPDSSPWIALSQAQIVEILKEIEAKKKK